VRFVVIWVRGFVGVEWIVGSGSDRDVDHVRVPSAADGSGGAGVLGDRAGVTGVL
jgi:hypothetical protein